MRQTVSFGVVGWSRTSREVVRRLADLPDVKLRWLCDPPSELRLGPLAHRLGARRTYDADVLFDDEQVDAVVVCAAYADRARLVRQALEADKHVLVLGPVAASAGDTERLLKFARAGKRVLDATTPRLREAAVGALSERLAEGALGELYYIDVDCGAAADAVQSGDVLSELAADDVASVLHVLQDRPVGVEATVESFSGDGTDRLTSSLRFANGVVASMRHSRLEASARHTIRVVGSHATAELDRRSSTHCFLIHHREDRNGGHSVAVRLPEVDPYAKLCDDFLTSVRSGALAVATGEMHAVAETIERISQSVRRSSAPLADARLEAYEDNKPQGEVSDARVALA